MTIAEKIIADFGIHDMENLFAHVARYFPNCGTAMKALLTSRYRHNYNGPLMVHDAPKGFASEEALRNDRNDFPTRVPDEHNAGSCTPLDHLATIHIE